MSNLTIPGEGYRPPGGVIVAEPGMTIKPESGATGVVVHGGVYFPPDATDVTVEPGLIFRPGPEYTGGRSGRWARALFNAGSMVQWCSPSVSWHGSDVDCGGLPIQGFQMNGYSATSPRPGGEVIDAIVRNNTLTPGDTSVGYNHAFYVRDGYGLRIENVLMDEIRGGGALHYYPNAESCSSAYCTARHPFASIYFWGPGTFNNHVVGFLVENQAGRSEKDGVVRGGGEHDNSLDYATVPTPGYGCSHDEPVPVPEPDELEARVLALEAFEARVQEWISAGQGV